MFNYLTGEVDSLTELTSFIMFEDTMESEKEPIHDYEACTLFYTDYTTFCITA